MGLIARIVNMLGPGKGSASEWRRQYRVDPGGGAAVTASQFAPAGDDSAPLKSDKLLLVEVPKSGVFCIVGYADTINTPEALAGERKLYARNAGGTIMCSLWLKADGSVHIEGAGSIVMEAGGNVVINGVTISPSGDISAPGSIEGLGITDTTNNVTLGTHNHGGDPPVPGT